MKTRPFLFIILAVVALGALWVLMLHPRSTALPSAPGPQIQATNPEEPGSPQITQSQAEFTLRGRVVDTQGQPLDKVAIRIASPNTATAPPNTYHSNIKGYFQVPLGSSNQGALIFRHGGFQDARLKYQGATQNLLVTMIPTATDQKQVLWIVNQAGEKIHGASVFCYPGETLTAIGGKAILSNFSELKTLNIYAEGYLRKTFTDFNDFENPHTIRLAQTWTLRARLSNRIAGTPIKRCQLRFEQEGKETFLEVDTNEGQISVPELPQQMDLIEIKAPDYHPLHLDQSQRVALKTESRIQHFELGKSIYTGTVVNSQGLAVEKAFVHFLNVKNNEIDFAKKYPRRADRKQALGKINTARPYRFPSGRKTRSKEAWSRIDSRSTDSSGNFKYHPDSDNFALDLLVYAPGYHPFFIQRADKLFSKNHGHYSIELKTFASISGLVGQAHATQPRRVILYDANFEEREWILQQGETHFEFADVPAGWASLKVHGVGDQSNSDPRHSAALNFPATGIVADQKWLEISAGEIYFEKIGFKQTYRLHGQVLRDNKPLQEELLEIYRVSSPSTKFGFRTDKQGFFEAERLPANIYGIRLAETESEPVHFSNRFVIDLTKDELKLVLNFNSGGNVFGRVVQPPKGVDLELWYFQINPWKELEYEAERRAFEIMRQNPYPRSGTYGTNGTRTGAKLQIPLDPSGLFKFENIPLGWVSLSVRDGDHAETLVHSVAMPERKNHLDLGDLHLDPKGHLEIFFQGGEPFADQEVYVFVRGIPSQIFLSENPEFITHPIGSLSIENLPTGTANIELEPENDPKSGFKIQSPLQVQIEPFKTTQVVATLIPTTYIKFLGKTPSQEGELMIEVRHPATGAFFRILERNDSEDLRFFASLDKSKSPYGMVFRAIHLPEGYYQFDFFINNQLARFFVFLEAGKIQEITVNPFDFVPN